MVEVVLFCVLWQIIAGCWIPVGYV